MTIWILALILLASLAGMGYRQGAIRVAFSFVGILVAALLAAPIGHIVQPLLVHLGFSNPILAWALAPVLGFILVSAAFKAAAFSLHRKVEVFYKYQAGDLRLALWERINARLGLCLGLANGAVYFLLVCFVIFNLSYWTTQVSAETKQTFLVKLVNQMGRDLEATGMARSAAAVGTMPQINKMNFYDVADLSGFLMQNPQVSPRLAEYPAFTSLWERPEMSSLIQNAALTNALAGGASLGEIWNDAAVQGFIENKELRSLVLGIVQTNFTDLTNYLQTGHSPKYDGEKILGQWEFNPGVTVAWLKQQRPKMTASEMRAIRAMLTQAYAQTRVLFTGDNKLFVKNLPKFRTDGSQPDLNNWSGEWNHSDSGYDLHISFNSEDKFMTATTEGLRMTVKDGKNLLIFDRAD